MQGRGGSYRGGVDHEGVGWVKQRWGGLCRGRWIMLGWCGVGMGGRSCRGGVGHAGKGWFIQGWGGS